MRKFQMGALAIFDVHDTLVEGNNGCRCTSECGNALQELLAIGVHIGINSNSALQTQSWHWLQIFGDLRPPTVLCAENGLYCVLPVASLLGKQNDTRNFLPMGWGFEDLAQRYARARKELIEFCRNRGIHLVLNGIPDRDSHSCEIQDGLRDGEKWALLDTNRRVSMFMDMRTVVNKRLEIDPSNLGILAECLQLVRNCFPGGTAEMEYLKNGFCGHHWLDPGKGPSMAWIAKSWPGQVYYFGDGANCASALRTKDVIGISLGLNKAARAAADMQIDTLGPAGVVEAIKLLTA